MISVKHKMLAMRAVLGWTQEQTGKYLDVTKQTVLTWEKGLHDVPASKYCKMVERYEKEIYVEREGVFFDVKKVKPEPPEVA